LVESSERSCIRSTAQASLLLAGSVAVSAAEQKLSAVRAELEKWRQLSAGTDGEFPSMSAAGLLEQIM
jgi:hypothetical protein